MVNGLDVFREHFRAFGDRYVLIGGTACDLAFGVAGLEFRATKDLDIVLCVEKLDAAFVRAFWEFVRTGGYARRESSTGKRRLYRFAKPSAAGFPEMLELFSRVPDILGQIEGGHLTPILVDGDLSSLSAILVDEAYYGWLQAGRREVAELPVVAPEHLIPLKARAWLDLRDRKASGQEVDGKAIRKHRNDVFRLYSVIDPEFRATLPATIHDDMQRFLADATGESVDLKALGLGLLSLGSVIAGLRTVYGLGPIPPVDAASR